MPAPCPTPIEWSVLLRALSAFEVYRRVYRDVITPVQGGPAPDPARRHAALAPALLQGGVFEPPLGRNEQSAETERRAGEMHAMLHFTRMEDILEQGLPEFLSLFLGRVNDLGDRVASDFLVPPAEA